MGLGMTIQRKMKPWAIPKPKENWGSSLRLEVNETFLRLLFAPRAVFRNGIGRGASRPTNAR